MRQAAAFLMTVAAVATVGGLAPARVMAAPVSPHRFAMVFRGAERSVVSVEATDASARIRHSSGFVAGPGGIILCPAETVQHASAVVVRGAGPWQEAQVLAVSARLRVAALLVPEAARIRPLPAAPGTRLRKGLWLVGVTRDTDGQARPAVGQVVLPDAKDGVLVTDAPAPSGSPLVDLEGRVVAMSLGLISARQSRVTALDGWDAFLATVAARARQLPEEGR